MAGTAQRTIAAFSLCSLPNPEQWRNYLAMACPRVVIK